MVSFKSLLLSKVNDFRGGQLEKHVRQWRKLTNDPNILSIISGGKIEFVDAPRIQHKARSTKFSDEEINLIKDEIDKLLTKSIIKETCHEKKEFPSPILSRKSNGGIRLILNLRQLNKNIEYHNFKMDSINTILDLITKDCSMASIDLKDEYYSVKISESFQRYLKFEFLDKLYKFVCFPNGLAPCPRKFTKITKIPLSDLRLRKIVVSGYIDDFFTKDHTSEGCFNNVMSIAELFYRLGFVVHPDKSILIPTQKITILGFIINSIKMSVKLTPQKEKKLKRSVNQLFSMKTPSIRFLAKVIGTTVSVFPAVKYAPLYYQALENDKIRASETCNGDFDSHHPISDDAKNDLKCYRDNNQMGN